MIVQTVTRVPACVAEADPQTAEVDGDEPIMETLKLLHISRPLLYLAANKEPMTAARKAFAILTLDGSSKARLTGEQVFAMMYPSGTGAGAHIFKVPYSAEQIQETVTEVFLNRGGNQDETPSITADHLLYSVPGSRLVSACGTHFVLHDLFLDFWRVKSSD